MESGAVAGFAVCFQITVILLNDSENNRQSPAGRGSVWPWKQDYRPNGQAGPESRNWEMFIFNRLMIF
jgi:hypothetical protein